MTKIEVAKKLGSGVSCNEIDCRDCPLNIPACRDPLTIITQAREWLAANDPKLIIGWPGNVEEMRQYEGKDMWFSDCFDFKTCGNGALFINNESKNFPYQRDRGGASFQYCRPIFLPAYPELTLSEIADKFGIPIDQLRIKDGER